MLPGQAQSNPFRWYALAACGVAVLAGIGLHTWLHTDDRRRRLTLLAGPLLVAMALAGVAAAALAVHLPDLRARNLQGFERTQVVRMAALASATIGVLAAAALARERHVRTAAGLLLLCGSRQKRSQRSPL